MSFIEDKAIEVEGYSFSYEGTDQLVLDNISFSIEQGAFAVLCGVTGSGKSTLLRALKPELAVAGTVSGRISILGKDPRDLTPVESATRVGFVQQDPENQLVTDTVWHELAFGLENIAMDTETMRRRVAETAHFFGIGSWFDRKVKDLSGGQKQLLNLASVVVMQPAILVLDEPTSQLDPIAAKDFFDVLGRVNDELGITVVIIEHRLEDVLPMADRVLFLEHDGKLEFDGDSAGFIHRVITDSVDFVSALPASTRIANLVDNTSSKYPVTVKQGREFLTDYVKTEGLDIDVAKARIQLDPEPIEGGKVLLRATDAWFRYSKEEQYVLRGVNFDVRAGQLSAIVGGNGSGKSTLLSMLAGTRKPERGKVKNFGDAKVALMTQNPKTLFVHDTVMADLMEWSKFGKYDESGVMEMLEFLDLGGLADRHPYDLSGGESQKAALAKILLLDPDVLLLDEPVKGIDAIAKKKIAQILTKLAVEKGKAVLFTAHDLEFVSEVAQICSMMFGCDVTCTQDCHGFFQDNLFYSTATSRITRGILDGCVSTSDVARALGKDSRLPESIGE